MNNILMSLEFEMPKTTYDWVCFWLIVIILSGMFSVIVYKLITGTVKRKASTPDKTKGVEKPETRSFPDTIAKSISRVEEIRAKVGRIKDSTSQWLDAIADMGDADLTSVLSLEEITEALPTMRRRTDERIAFLVKAILDKCQNDEDFNRVRVALGINHFNKTILGDSAKRWIDCSSSCGEYVTKYFHLEEPSWARSELERRGFEALEKVWDDQDGLDRISRMFCLVYNSNARYVDLEDDEKVYCPVYLRASERLTEFRVNQKIMEVGSYTMSQVIDLFRDLDCYYRGSSTAERLREPARTRALELTSSYSVQELVGMARDHRTEKDRVVREIQAIIYHKIDQIVDVDQLLDIGNSCQRRLFGNCAMDSLQNQLSEWASQRALSRRMELLRSC